MIILISHLHHNVVTPYLNCIIETFQIRGHNKCFYAELTKINPNYQQILPPSYLELWKLCQIMVSVQMLGNTILIISNAPAVINAAALFSENNVLTGMNICMLL